MRAQIESSVPHSVQHGRSPSSIFPGGCAEGRGTRRMNHAFVVITTEGEGETETADKRKEGTKRRVLILLMLPVNW